MLNFLQNILQSKDFIESILLLLVTFVSIEAIAFSFESISSLLSILFAGLILLTTIVKVTQSICKLIKNAKYTKRICIYGSMSYASVCHKLSKVMNMKFHPAAYASLKLHIENLVYSDLQNK